MVQVSFLDQRRYNEQKMATPAFLIEQAEKMSGRTTASLQSE
ncbi:hypothetical protein ACO0LO_03805 [Undibacterium sp. TJN25]